MIESMIVLAIEFLTAQSMLLIAGGFIIGILSVVFGGGFFFSVPLMQWIFPMTTFGTIIGNLKVGSFFRGISSTMATRKQIAYKQSILLSLLAILGTFMGAMLVSHIGQGWLLPATILAVLLAELAPRISKLISNRTFHIASFLTGLYAGVFGAGIGLLLVALFRLKHTKDEDIVHVKIHARFIEFVLGIIAVVTHWVSGNLIAAIWIPWSIGSLLGGYVGGYALKIMNKFSGKVQKLFLRISYVIAIATSAIKL